MAFSEQLDGATWRGVARGRGRRAVQLMVLGAVACLAVVAGVGAAVGLPGVALAALAAVSAVAGGMVSFYLLGAFSPLELELRVEPGGLTLQLIRPLPWEFLAAQRAWPGRWHDLALHLPWDEVADVEITPDGAFTALLCGDAEGSRMLRLLHAPPVELAILDHAIRAARGTAAQGTLQPLPEDWAALQHPAPRQGWGQTVRNLGELELGAPIAGSPDPHADAHPRETVDALRIARERARKT